MVDYADEGKARVAQVETSAADAGCRLESEEAAGSETISALAVTVAEMYVVLCVLILMGAHPRRSTRL